MPLPTEARTPWPPLVQGLNVWPEMEEWAAWYSGDPNRIAKAHVNKLTPDRKRMWAQEVTNERRTMLHVPLAGDIAGVAADLLFGEAPKYKIPAAHDDKATQEAKDTQARLDLIVYQAGVTDRARSGAETSSAMGGVFIKANWDKRVKPFPFLSIAQADSAVPEFRFGFLVAVTFWRELPSSDATVWRHLERHELDNDGNGVILNGLYRGNQESLGKLVPIDQHPDTAHMKGEGEVLAPGVPGLLCEYVPNRGPNRLWRGSSLGMSDFSGSEGFLDALDEVYTSWIRDIQLGARRLVVPEQWLDWTQEDGNGNPVPSFDKRKEVFTGLNVDPNATDKAGLTIVDFEIRAESHAKTALELIDRIVSAAQYSPQSFGLKIEGSAESGTALRVRERKSFTTTGKKGLIWRRALERMLKVVLALDALLFKTPGLDPNQDVAVELNDGAQPDVSELAASVELVNRAQAASIRTKVAMMHPDWTKEQVEAEAKQIEKEQGLLAPDPMQVGIG